MTERRAPYAEVPEKWKAEVIEAVRSSVSDAIDQLYQRWCQMGYTPRLVIRCMEFPDIVLELSEPEKVRLAEAVCRLDKEFY
jgi:hypothetical protein